MKGHDRLDHQSVRWVEAAFHQQEKSLTNPVVEFLPSDGIEFKFSLAAECSSSRIDP
jgi:hypothetical protein